MSERSAGLAEAIASGLEHTPRDYGNGLRRNNSEK
jgi:hypothetical protein